MERSTTETNQTQMILLQPSSLVIFSVKDCKFNFSMNIIVLVFDSSRSHDLFTNSTLISDLSKLSLSEN